MQLLFEEFFKKVYSLSKGKTSITLFIFVRLLFLFLIIGGIVLVIFLIFTNNYKIILIILGVIILGEAAHYIRKWREKEMGKAASIENNTKEHTKEMLKSVKSKNKSLLSHSKPKNDVLLDKKKVGAVRVKKK